MKKLDLRDKAIIAGLFIAKFNKVGLQTLGFSSFIEAYNTIGFSLNIKPLSIRGYRDEFDAQYEHRQGWNRKMREYCKKIYDEFGSLDFEAFLELMKEIIFPDYQIQQIIENLEIAEKEDKTTFAKRLMTGIAAEQYFKNVYTQINIFENLTLEDTTKYGCGFDFKLSNENTFYGVEVKGLNGKKGSISLTNKEYKVAQLMTENYFVFLVKNFKEEPYHEIYQNPINGQLSFKKIDTPIIQVNWLANV